MEDERLIFSIITPDTPKHLKKKLYRAIGDFEEKGIILGYLEINGKSDLAK